MTQGISYLPSGDKNACSMQPSYTCFPCWNNGQRYGRSKEETGKETRNSNSPLPARPPGSLAQQHHQRPIHQQPCFGPQLEGACVLPEAGSAISDSPSQLLGKVTFKSRGREAGAKKNGPSLKGKILVPTLPLFYSLLALSKLLYLLQAPVSSFTEWV